LVVAARAGLETVLFKTTSKRIERNFSVKAVTVDALEHRDKPPPARQAGIGNEDRID
jgi:hypothetical protein